MRLIILIIFSMTIAILSNILGLYITQEPIKYLAINIPAIICFDLLLEIYYKERCENGKKINS